jgi:parallel beta-helix repeat protein
MKKLVTFASDVRINALLCCSAAVLLTACGGGMSDTTSGQSQTAASLTSSSDQSAANSAATTTPNAADAAKAPAAEAAAAGNFELSGYGSDSLSGAEADASAPAAAAQADTASQAAPADGAPRLLASISASAPTMSAAATTATPATTYNYYVSPTGSDTAAGTKAAPFKTLARAAKAATAANTTVWVAPGTYAGGIKTTANGTAAGRIYWVSTTKWGAKIVPPSSSSNNNAWDNRGNYVSIIGFDVDGTNSGSGTKWTHGIYTGGSYGMIQDNHIHHIARSVACTSAGGSAIGVDSYYHGVKSDIVSNVVNDIGPAGCTYVQGIYVSTSGTIKNNLVYRVGAVGIHLWHDATDVIITNNTVTSSNFGMVVGGGDFYYTSAGANNVYVANNIIYDNKYGISEQGKTGTGNKYVNNLVFQNPTYDISLRNGLKATGTISSNPLFKAYSRTAAAPDYHLTTSSPAIGRGTATNAYPTDLDGKPRNASTGYDLGAYQH